MFPFPDVDVAQSELLTSSLCRYYDMLANAGVQETEKHGMVECLLYLQQHDGVSFGRRSFTDLTGNEGKASLCAGVVFEFSKLTSIEATPEAETKARKLLRENLSAQQIQVFEGSFLSADWLDSDVVYFDACSLGELDELLIVDRFVKICQKLLPGTYVVICSRWPALPPHQHLVTVYEATTDDKTHGELRHTWILRR